MFRSYSEDDFSESHKSLKKLNIDRFQKLNKNVDTLPNKILYIDYSLWSYYNYSLTRAPILLSIAHLVGTISICHTHWFQITSTSRQLSVLSLFLREIVTLTLLNNTSDNDYFYVGNVTGILWAGTTLFNVAILILTLQKVLLVAAYDGVDNCLKLFRNHDHRNANMSLVAAGKIDLEGNSLSADSKTSLCFSPGVGDSRFAHPPRAKDKDKEYMREKRTWNFLFLDIFTTIRMFKHTSCYGILSSLVVLKGFSASANWKMQLEARKCPLTIITVQNPLFVVSDFESMCGFEYNQHEFARTFLYFADPDQVWFSFYSLKENCIHRFLLKKRNILLSDSGGNGVYDTVLRFTDCNPNESRKRKLIYSTVSFDVDLFCKGAPEKYTFMTAIMDVLGNKDVNLFLKRIICNMAAAKWHNVYHGAMMTKYLLTEFSEVAFWVVPKNKPPFYYNRGALDLKKTADRKRVVKLCEETKQCTVHNFGDKDVSGKHNEENVHIANFLVF